MSETKKISPDRADVKTRFTKESSKKAIQARTKKTRTLTNSVREGVATVYEMLGGHIAYYEWAKANPSKFYDHFIRTIPLEAKVDVNVRTDYTDVLEAARRRIIDSELTKEVEDDSAAEDAIEAEYTKTESND